MEVPHGTAPGVVRSRSRRLDRSPRGGDAPQFLAASIQEGSREPPSWGAPDAARPPYGGLWRPAGLRVLLRSRSYCSVVRASSTPEHTDKHNNVNRDCELFHENPCLVASRCMARRCASVSLQTGFSNCSTLPLQPRVLPKNPSRRRAFTESEQHRPLCLVCGVEWSPLRLRRMFGMHPRHAQQDCRARNAARRAELPGVPRQAPSRVGCRAWVDRVAVSPQAAVSLPGRQKNVC